MNGKPTDAAGRGTSIRDFVAVIFRRKWIILSVFAITATVTAATVLSRPTVWESTGKILVKRGVKDSIYGSYIRTLSWAEDLSSEVETARSTVVLQRAQGMVDKEREKNHRPRVVIDPARVAVAVQGESNVLGISYADLKPEVCVEVANAVMQAYMDYRHDAYSLPYPAQFFTAESTRTHDEMTALQEQRRQLLDRSGLTDGSVDLNQMLQVKSSDRLVTDDLVREEAELHARYDMWKKIEQNPDADIPSSTTGEALIQSIKNELIVAQLKYTEASKIFQPDVPQVQSAKAKIDDLQKMLTDEVRSRVKAAEMEWRSKQAQLAAAEGRLTASSAHVAAFPAADAQLAEFDRRIAALRESYGNLVKAAQEARVNTATEPSWTVLLLSPAGAAYAKNTKDYVRIALAPVFSLIVGLGLAFFVDSMDSSVKTPREAETVLDLPVLATLSDRRKR
jgi:polysaccharide biosynthesis transport protein